MAEYGQWWTSPTQSIDNGKTIIVTGRRDVDKFRSNPKFNIRVEITWPYTPADNSGMPGEEDARLMEQATDALLAVFAADPVAVMTGIYTGDDMRNWVFYTLSTHIFQKKINEALAPLPPLPLQIYCENDPEWEEYAEMRSNSEIDID